MRIIFKFILTNIKEKKFRTFLIVLSVMVSSALFFASSAISGTFERMYLETMKKYYGDSDIMIHAGDNSPTSFIYTAKAEKYKDRLEYIAGVVQTSGFYKYKKNETVRLDLRGISLDDLYRMNPIILYKELKLEPFEGRKIIISRKTSEMYNLSPGDTVDLEIRDSKHKFTVAGISEPVGPFTDDGQSTYAVVPLDALNSIFDARGKASVIYIKLKNPSEKQVMINKLSKEYERYIVREPITQEQLKRSSSGITTPFMVVSLIVLFMSVFIIYTSFKVITMERLPVIGTFRSIGATRKMTDLVLIAESIFYGVTGGILGCALGTGILYIMSYLTTPEWMKGVKTTIQFTPWQLFCSLLMAILLSFVSSLIPVMKISRIPIKDIVLYNIEKENKRKSGKSIMGIVLLVFSLIIPYITPESIGLIVVTSCMLLLMASVVLLIPAFTNMFVKILGSVYVFLFGNEGLLAAKNLSDNKSILNNISLLTIGIATLLMINATSHSVLQEVSNIYTKNAGFDIGMFVQQADRSFTRSLYTVDGVRDVYGSFQTTSVEVPGTGERIGWVDGIDTTKYLGFWKIDMPGDAKELLAQLDSGRNIILANNAKDKLNAKIGDTITLQLNNGKRSYKIIGFMNTLLQNGDYALISDRYFKADTGIRYYNDIYIKTYKAPEEVLENLKKEFSRKSPWLMTMKQMEERNINSNAQMFSILKGFSIMSLLIGIIGVLNNLLISFIERKRHFAMLRSIGMSKFQIVKMIFIEAFTGGLIGSTIGIITALLMIINMPFFFKAADLPPIPIQYTADILLSSFVSGIAIMLAASVSPAVKSSKLNIIEAIKYE